MTWTGYWLPNLVQWLLGGSLGAGVSVIVGFLIRRALRQLAGEQQATAKTAQDAADTTTEAIEAWKKRTDDLLTAVLRQEVLVLEVERIKEYLAEHETERHVAVRRITST